MHEHANYQHVLPTFTSYLAANDAVDIELNDSLGQWNTIVIHCLSRGQNPASSKYLE